METRNRKEADRILRDQELPPGEKVRNSREFSPGVNPDSDRFGMPGGEPENRYYPDSDPVSERRPRPPQPGGTDADRVEGINVDELDRPEIAPDEPVE